MIEDIYNESIAHYFQDSFQEFLSDVHASLKKTNPKYKDLCAKKSEILEKHPKLRDVIENQKILSLNSEDVVAFRELYYLEDTISDYEQAEMVIRGAYEALLLSKKISAYKGNKEK